MSEEKKMIGGIGLITLLIFIGGIFFMSRGGQEQKTVMSAEDIAILARNNDHKITSKNAKVTVVEFADFQCPACGATHPVLKQILDEYKGKVTFVYRHFPLPQHQNAIIAAKAAEAAGSQGKFWEMHDMLYENQSDWGESGASAEIFVQYAKSLKLDVKKFTSDLNSKAYDNRIQQDKVDGMTLGVNATPTLYINNEKLVGSTTYENLKATIDVALQKK